MRLGKSEELIAVTVGELTLFKFIILFCKTIKKIYIYNYNYYCISQSVIR